MSINFQEILKELEYRVEHGIIDLNKEEQVTTLAEILKENGIPDANQMAQKARVYFSYINEASLDEKLPTMSAKPKKNPSNGGAAAGQKQPTAKPQSSDSLASKEAHKLGLVSKGYGRWAKTKDGPVTYMTDKETGKLVPVGVADEPGAGKTGGAGKAGDKKDAGVGVAGGAAEKPKPNISTADFKSGAEKRAARANQIDKHDAGLSAASEYFKDKKYKNSNGDEVSFDTAINYNEPQDKAHEAAMDDFEAFLNANQGEYGTLENPKQPDQQTEQEPKEYQPTETQAAIFKGRKAELLEVIQKGFLGGEKKITSGVGAFEPDEEQLQALVDITKKQLKNPNYKLKLPSYKIDDNDIDLALGVIQKGLGGEAYQKWVKQVTNAGAVDSFLTSGTKPGSNGYNRFRAIVRKYMETGGRSAVTGKFVPFNRMQLDHHIPFGSAAEAVKDKKRKGIKTTIEAEKARLDSAPNWDLMETALNQFKNSLEGNDLIKKAMKRLSMNPDEKELKKVREEIKTLGRTQLFDNLINSFGKGDYSGFNQETLGKLNAEDLQMVAKAWNYWHPDIKQNDTKNFAAADPNYLAKLKKAGIDIQKRDPSFVVRYKAQVGGSRTRSQAKKPELMRADLYNGMKKAKIGLSKKESIGTDTSLAKAILSVEKKSKELINREKELKARLKSSNTKR